MAKQLTSRYWPGQRSPAWRKIKPVHTVPCRIVGYTAAAHGLHSLLVATLHAGALRYVGALTRGWDVRQGTELAGRLAARRRPEPVVACPKAALWVEAQLYCRVQFLGWTAQGRLRGGVFRGLLDGAA